MKLKHLFLLFFIALILSNCIKVEDDFDSQNCPSSCTIIKGRLTTLNGNQGLANVYLETRWINTQYLAGGTVRKKAKTHTDKDGYYQMKFLINDNELIDGYFKVYYEVDENKYLVFGEKSFAMDLKRDTTITANYLIPKKALLDVKLEGEIPSNATFITTFKSNMGWNGGFGSGPTVILSGTTQTAGLPSKPFGVCADQPIVVETIRSTNDSRTFEYDTITVPSGQTIPYILKY